MKKNVNFTFLLFSVFFFASCKKIMPSLPPPVAEAGKSQTVQLPLDETTLVTLKGSGRTWNGGIVGYLWSLVSGPNVPVITSPGAATTTISNLVPGTYHFQFEVIDEAGLTGVDTTSVIVKGSLFQTLTLQPANNLFEGYVDLYYPDKWFTGNTELPISAWTAYGLPETQRTAIKFDYSALPAGAIVKTATLYLYAMPNPQGGNLLEAHSGDANACYIQRITSNWTTTVNPFTYNNEPAITADNAAVIPQSTSPFQNDVINVTALVKDMLPGSNNGFFILLQNENIYNIRQYASSYYSNAALHPKLVITYQ